MQSNYTDFDVIVVGGGHAGIEAAHAAARMGSKTLLITLDIHKIGLMPCNPAIGGVGKGHLVYEISALGGLMPRLCTQTYIQARMLNTRKGPAVQGLRLQIDKDAYSALSKTMLEQVENLTLLASAVENILLSTDQKICGIRTKDGIEYHAPNVILTTGTFLNGTIHIGAENSPGGRQSEQADSSLSDFLKKAGLQIGRMKTGTPPRLLRSSLDFSKMTLQEADNLTCLFEFYPHKVKNTHHCYITHTNEKTHEIIQKNLPRSARYNGNITGVGPRYCPAIEDKIVRFPDKTSHHVFVEPEGANSPEVYPNGISTSLPREVQKQYVQSIVGFENAIIVRPGYAVEYDFVLPNQLQHTLEVKSIPGLFLAGQINGTTGYEEAAGQGLIAGINAHLRINNQPPFVLDRTESYIGVMIDDLVSLGVDEPYRMFTSRAERRLILRQDNAFLRLTEKGYQLGLINKQLYNDFAEEKKAIEQTFITLRKQYTSTEMMQRFGQTTGNAQELFEETGIKLSERAALTVHAEIRYEPYLHREEKEIKKAKQYQALELPAALQYTDLPGLSKELQQKLNKHKPKNIAQATLIPGMTPAAISLLIYKARKINRTPSKLC